MIAKTAEDKRKLSTVLYADVAGYTRLTEVDETNTHQALKRALHSVSHIVVGHGGTVVHYAGDSVLAEFTSVLQAINSAFEIQRVIAQQNETFKMQYPLLFRVGINIGDVISDGNEIYGDTVNTAVRLQTLAEPGGICISEAVRNAIGKRLPVDFEFLGDEKLKNLSIPVRAYRAVLNTAEVAEEPLSTEDGKPVVGVMPLGNPGGNDDGLSECLTEDITRELSRFHGLSVVAHHSTLVYKNKGIKVQDLAEELGVGYVVEGYLRETKNGVRINIQLIDVLTGHHLWSEKFDSAPAELESLIRNIVCGLASRVHAVSSQDALNSTSDHLRAFDYVLRGQALVGKGSECNNVARSNYKRSLALDPNSSRASSGIALSFVDDFWNGWTKDPKETLESALAAAKAAYSHDITDSKAHWVLGLVYLLRGEPDRAERLIERAIALNPNDSDAFAVLALWWLHKGDREQPITLISQAMSLNPFPSAWYNWLLGVAHYYRGELQDARNVLLESLEQNPKLNAARFFLVAACDSLNEVESSRIAANEIVQQLPPAVGAAQISECLPIPSGEARQRLIEALRKANIPD